MWWLEKVLANLTFKNIMDLHKISLSKHLKIDAEIMAKSYTTLVLTKFSFLQTQNKLVSLTAFLTYLNSHFY
jgi:hypothetical protein